MVGGCVRGEVEGEGEGGAISGRGGQPARG